MTPTPSEILALAGAAGTIFVCLSAVRLPGCFSFPMAIVLRRWWPAWFWFYSCLLYGSLAALVAPLLVFPIPKTIYVLAPPAILLNLMYVFFFHVARTHPQPCDTIELRYAGMEFRVRRLWARMFAAALAEKLKLEIFRTARRSGADMILLVERRILPDDHSCAVILETPGDGDLIRVRCAACYMSSRWSPPWESLGYRIRCRDVARALNHAGAHIDIEALSKTLRLSYIEEYDS